MCDYEIVSQFPHITSLVWASFCVFVCDFVCLTVTKLTFRLCVPCSCEDGRSIEDSYHSMPRLLPAFYSGRLPRTKYTSQQMAELEHEFQRNPYPSVWQRNVMASKLAVHQTRIQVSKSICISMYVCMYVCIHVCMRVCMHVYVCMYICACTYVYACMYPCMYACVCLSVYMYMCVCVCMCICVCVYVCMYVCVYFANEWIRQTLHVMGVKCEMFINFIDIRAPLKYLNGFPDFVISAVCVINVAI